MANETVQTNDPWGPAQPFLQALFDQAGAVAQVPRDYYGSVAPFSPLTEMAMGMQMQRGMAGSPVQDAFGNYLTGALGQGQINLGGSALTAQNVQAGLPIAQRALADSASGQMLGANPYRDQMMDAASDAVSRNFRESVMPGIHATFGSGGRAGSNAHVAAMGRAEEALGNQLGNMAANIYGQGFEAERGRQMQAAGQLQGAALGGVGALGSLYGNIDQAQSRAGALAPQQNAMEWGNIDRLMGTGAMVDEQARALLGDNIARQNFYRDDPRGNLEWMLGMVGGNQYGGRQTVSQPGSVIGRVLGGAGTGAGIGGAIGSPFGPAGAGIGAGVGAGVGALGVGLYELFS